MTPSSKTAALSPYTVYLIMRGLASLSFSMWVTVIMLYHTTFITSDPLQLAFIGVVLEASTFLFEIPTGLFADTLGRRRSVIIGFLITGAAFIFEGSFQLLPTVLLAEFLWGVGFTFYSGANDAWIADEGGLEQANHAYMRGTQIALICGLLGTALAVPLGSIHLSVPIVLAGVGQILLAVFLMRFMTEHHYQPEKRKHSLIKETRLMFSRSRALVRQRPVLRYILFIGMTIGLSAGGFDRLYTPHLIKDFTLPSVESVIWLGMMSTTLKILTIFTVEWARRRRKQADQAQLIRILSWFYTGTIVGNVVFALSANLPLAIACYLFSQTLRESSKPLFLGWINQHAESGVRATVISMYWQSNALGNIFGTPIVGLIGTLTSLRVALTAAALALSPALWFYQRANHAGQPEA